MNSNVGERRQEENMKVICVRFVNHVLAVCGCYCLHGTCYLFAFLFQVPLISCASPWRAGETKNGACPKLESKL